MREYFLQAKDPREHVTETRYGQGFVVPYRHKARTLHARATYSKNVHSAFYCGADKGFA